MPEENSGGFFKGASDALRLAVPLVIQKRRLDAAKQQFDAQMGLKMLELNQESDLAKDQIVTGMYKSAFEKAIETGDENLARNVLTSLQGGGYDMGGFQIPDQLEGTPPKSLEELLARRMGESTQQNIINTMTKLNESKKTAAEKLPPEVAQSWKVISKFTDKIDPMTALLLSQTPGLLEDPSVKEKLTQGVPEEVKPMFNKAVGILNKYYGIKGNNNDPLGIR